jgi:hypothetical protein
MPRNGNCGESVIRQMSGGVRLQPDEWHNRETEAADTEHQDSRHDPPRFAVTSVISANVPASGRFHSPKDATEGTSPGLVH